MPAVTPVRDKTLSADDAARIVLDGDTVAVGGFVGVGVPEALLAALERRFLSTGSPTDLSLVFVAGQGDRGERGLNHLAHAGLVRRAVGGHWGLAPRLGRLALDDAIEGYCLPQGIISQLFRDIAAHRPGALTRVGLGTFADPRVDGGRISASAKADVVQLVELGGETYLFVPAFPVHVGLIRATTADPDGNLTMEREALVTEVLAIAQAVRNSGGVVIAQVERVTDRHRLPPQMVRVPGALVDAVVVADPADHPQTFAETYNPAYTGEVRTPGPQDTLTDRPASPAALDARTVVARRAALFLRTNAVVNLGIGVPEGVAAVAREEGVLDRITLTVEPGGFGGLPAGGLSFGASQDAAAVIDQPAMFDFYDGGGLDQAFLGFAEIDRDGNVNVSRFGDRLAGAGGFVNISQNARAVHFLGTFAARGRVAVEAGEVRVVEPGRSKFVERVGHVTFSADQARRTGRPVHYVTERAVFRLADDGIELVEVAPGVDVEVDVLAAMPFRPLVREPLAVMDPVVLRPGPMGLRHRPVVPWQDRVQVDDDGVAYLNFEGLQLDGPADVAALARLIDERLAGLGAVDAVVDYDNFVLAPAAADAYWDMVRRNTAGARRFRSLTRYSTNAFLRRRLGQRFAAARLDGRLYASYAEARDHL